MSGASPDRAAGLRINRDDAPGDSRHDALLMDAAGTLPHDHALDWVEDLRRITASAAELPPSARRAVLDVLTSFAIEDGVEPPPAEALLAALELRLPRAVRSAA